MYKCGARPRPPLVPRRWLFFALKCAWPRRLQNLGGVTVTVLTSQFTYTSRTLLSLTRTIDISVTRAGVTGKFDPSGRSSCITRWRQVVLADSDAVGYEYWLLLLQSRTYASYSLCFAPGPFSVSAVVSTAVSHMRALHTQYAGSFASLVIFRSYCGVIESLDYVCLQPRLGSDKRLEPVLIKTLWEALGIVPTR